VIQANALDEAAFVWVTIVVPAMRRRKPDPAFEIGLTPRGNSLVRELGAVDTSSSLASEEGTDQSTRKRYAPDGADPLHRSERGALRIQALRT